MFTLLDLIHFFTNQIETFVLTNKKSNAKEEMIFLVIFEVTSSKSI